MFVIIIALFRKHIWFPFVHNCCRKVVFDDTKWPRSIFSILCCIQISRFNCTDLLAFSITSVSLIYSWQLTTKSKLGFSVIARQISRVQHCSTLWTGVWVSQRHYVLNFVLSVEPKANMTSKHHCIWHWLSLLYVVKIFATENSTTGYLDDAWKDRLWRQKNFT